MQVALVENEGGTADASNSASATGESGEGDWQGQGRREHSNGTRGGRKDVRGKSGLQTYPGGPTSLGGLRRLGACQSRHSSGQRHP